MPSTATGHRRRLIGVAHRFLPLPLAPEVLLEALTSLEELREVLDSPRLRDAIGRIEKLPSPPHLYLSLTQALEHDDDTDSADVAKLVAADPAIAARCCNCRTRRSSARAAPSPTCGPL